MDFIYTDFVRRHQIGNNMIEEGKNHSHQENSDYSQQCNMKTLEWECLLFILPIEENLGNIRNGTRGAVREK